MWYMQHSQDPSCPPPPIWLPSPLLRPQTPPPLPPLTYLVGQHRICCVHHRRLLLGGTIGAAAVAAAAVAAGLAGGWGDEIIQGAGHLEGVGVWVGPGWVWS